MTKPTHIEFLDSSQFSFCDERNKDGSVNLHVKCQLTTLQSKIVKDALQQDYDIVFVNQSTIILPPAKETTVYKNVRVIDGVAFLDIDTISVDM